MSTHNDIDIACANCGQDFRGTIWTAVHAGQDPELKDLLLGGELNMVMCPECAHVSYEDHFVLYQEPAAELVAYVYPPSQRNQEAELQRGMIEGFDEAQKVYSDAERKTYRPMLFFGLASLVEFLRQEEEKAEQSQVAQEICREKQWPMTLLRPSEARTLQTLRVIPASAPEEGRRPPRGAILEGIDRLLKVNPALNLYGQLQDRIQSDPAWHL